MAMLAQSLSQERHWLRIAKPAALLLLLPLLLSPADCVTASKNAEKTSAPVSATEGSLYGSEADPTHASPDVSATMPNAAADPYTEARSRMVREQIEARGVKDARVLAAMREVPRHRFVPTDRAAAAYQDHPLAIGYRQTISQPYIVAAMTELAKLEPGSKVLEVGTGSGYQAAVIHQITGEVFSLEIVGELAKSAQETLALLGYDKAHVRHANGYLGWPEEAPFDAILVTAAPPEVPKALLDQLVEGGRLVVPVGTGAQTLEVHTRRGDRFTREAVFGVRFVPMVERARSGTGVGEEPQ